MGCVIFLKPETHDPSIGNSETHGERRQHIGSKQLPSGVDKHFIGKGINPSDVPARIVGMLCPLSVGRSMENCTHDYLYMIFSLLNLDLEGISRATFDS